MATLAQLAAAAASLVEDAEVQHAIIHGPASGTGSTVTTEGGEVPTHAKQAVDFSTASSDAIDTFNASAQSLLDSIEAALAGLTGGTLSAFLTVLGVPSFANLTEANATLGIGSIFFNQDTSTLAITTA